MSEYVVEIDQWAIPGTLFPLPVQDWRDTLPIWRHRKGFVRLPQHVIPRWLDIAIERLDYRDVVVDERTSVVSIGVPSRKDGKKLVKELRYRSLITEQISDPKSAPVRLVEGCR